jgi:predicted Zn-dependent protease
MSNEIQTQTQPEVHIRTQLDYPMAHYFEAAIGWLELGNAVEAQAELDRLSFAARALPEVKVVLWKVLAAQQKWDRSLEVARELLGSNSTRPTSWICLAFSLVHTCGVAEATRALTEAAANLPESNRSVPSFLSRQTERLAASPDPNRWLRKWEQMEAQLLQAQAQRKQAEAETVPVGAAANDGAGSAKDPERVSF